MVKIKIPDVTEKLSTKTIGTQRPSDFTAVHKAVQTNFDQIANTAEVFRKGIVTEQVSLATLSLNEQMNQLEQDYKNNPSLTASHADEFANDANEILIKQLNTIGDPQVTRQFEVQQRASIMAQTNSVRSAGRDAQMDRYNVQTTEIKQQEVNKTIKTGDPVKQVLSKQRFIDQLNRGVGNLWMSHQERAKQIAEFDESVRLGKPQNDLDTMVATQGSLGAERFKGMIESRKVYKLDEKEIESFLDQADNVMRREKEREKQAVEAEQEENLTVVINDLFGPVDQRKSTVPILKGLKLAKKLTDTDANNAIDLLETLQGVNVTTDVPFYNELQEKIHGVRVKPDGSRFSQAEIKSEILANGGRLNHVQARGLIDDMSVDRDQFNDQINKNALLKVKQYAQEQVGAELLGIGGVKGETQAFINKLIFQYHEKRLREQATGNRLYEIAQEVIDNDKIDKDKNFDPSDPNAKKQKMFPEGSERINLSNGEIWKVIGGQWVLTNQRP